MPIDDEKLKAFILKNPVPDRLVRDLSDAMRIEEEDMPPDGIAASAARHRREVSLTPAAAKVLWLASHGMESKMIADVLEISLETVKTHLKAVRYALHAKNTTHAVAQALREGLID